MNGGPVGNTLLLLAAVGAVVIVVAVVRDELTRPPSLRRRIGAAAVVLAIVVGAGLLLWPVTASTGATCLFGPATDVLGPEGSADAVASAADETDRTSTQSCIDTARVRVWSGLGLVALAGASYVAVRRRDPSALATTVAGGGQRPGGGR